MVSVTADACIAKLTAIAAPSASKRLFDVINKPPSSGFGAPAISAWDIGLKIRSGGLRLHHATTSARGRGPRVVNERPPHLAGAEARMFAEKRNWIVLRSPSFPEDEHRRPVME